MSAANRKSASTQPDQRSVKVNPTPKQSSEKSKINKQFHRSVFDLFQKQADKAQLSHQRQSASNQQDLNASSKMSAIEESVGSETENAMNVNSGKEVFDVSVSDMDINQGEEEDAASMSEFWKLSGLDPKTLENADEMPSSVDIRLVLKMFGTLRGDIAEANRRLLELSKENNKEKIENLSLGQQAADAEIENLKTEVNEYKIRTTILTGALNRTNAIVNELQEKMEKLEISQNKLTLSISGFYASEKKEIRAKQLSDFFMDEMGVDVNITDSFVTGEQVPPNVIFTVSSQAEKSAIFQNIDNIKKLVNKDERKFYIKDYLPAVSNESRRAQQDLKRTIKRVNPSANIVTKKGQIFLEGQKVEKRLSVPDPTEILQMDENKLEEILNLKLSKSPKLIKNDNTFVGYGICTDRAETAQQAYMNVKLANAGARHIVAVWNIPSDKHYEVCDFQDDEEHGAGRVLKSIFMKNDIQCRAIFIARYATSKIGPARYQSYVDVLEALIAQSPYNPILGKEEKLSDTTKNSQNGKEDDGVSSPPPKKMVTNAPSYSTSNRGRGRGGASGVGYSHQSNKATARIFTPKDEAHYNNKEKNSYTFNPPIDFSNGKAWSDAVKKSMANLHKHLDPQLNDLN